MPQKRNPVALEHARSIVSKALGQAVAVVTAVHNTPFGDIVDTEDDLQPLVASMFRDAQRAVALLAAAIRGAEFDVERMTARATEGGTTLTEVADRLVREKNLPFTKAHAIAAATGSSPISGREFVDVRRTPGGPAPEETSRALDASRSLLDRDRAWVAGVRQAVADANAVRQQRARAI
jgi:argininosuccinate lyase